MPETLAPATITTIANFAGILLVVASLVGYLAALVFYLKRDKDYLTALYYGSMFGIGASLAFGNANGQIPMAEVAAKWAGFLVSLTIFLAVRKKRPGARKNGWAGPGNRGTMMVLPLPLMLVWAMFPMMGNLGCRQWWAAFGGGMGFLVGGAMTLNVPAAVTGAFMIIGAGDYPC